MRPAAVDRGIFLLVPLKTRTWRVDGRVLSFAEVACKLAAHAKKVAAKAYKEIAVAAVDIAGTRLKKHSSPTSPRATQAPKRRARTTTKPDRRTALSKKRGQ